jgi:hypothetical protein
MSDVLEERNGFRVLIGQEMANEVTPDGDFFGYVFSVGQYGGADCLGKAYSTPDTTFDLDQAFEEWQDWDDVGRALMGELDECTACGQRIEKINGTWVTYDPLQHDQCDNVHCTCEPTERIAAHEPGCPVPASLHDPNGMFHDPEVVGLDWFSLQDSTLVNVVTRADLKVWGWDVDEPNTWPKTPTEGNLTEWKAWAEGDVWYFSVQRAIDWSTDAEGHEDDTMTTWETVEAIGGFFGWGEHVEAEARSTFEATIADQEAGK